MQLWNQLVSGKFWWAAPIQIQIRSKVMDEQLTVAYSVVGVVDLKNRKLGLIMLRYNVDKPESSYAPVRLIARNMNEERYQQIAYVSKKLDEFF